MFPIVGVVQKYEWGKKGKKSEVAGLYSNSSENCDVEEDTPYAELWLGTHRKAPSRVEKSGEELSIWLQNNHTNIKNGNECDDIKNGETRQIKDASDGQLPFLLKVLSIEKSLSIQIHPNKLEAGILHSKDSYHYPDSNHKPEMTIALTPFEALCAFKPFKEVFKSIQDIEELSELVTRKGVNEQESEVKSELQLERYFRNLMTSETQHVRFHAQKLHHRTKNSDSPSDASIDLFMRLMHQHEGDVGCFCAFFLNHITLLPGQSLFLKSNLPHAYISGDCIECMACSDNVIRAGLTGKYRDVETLCRLVDYASMTPSQVLFTPSPTQAGITVYNPPVPEFAVDKIELPSDFSSFQLPTLRSHSIMLVIKGTLTVRSKQSSMVLCRGKSMFVSSACEVSLSPVELTGGGDVLLFRAYSTG